MSNVLAGVMERGRVVTATQFIAIVGIATIVPLFHQQAITGPIVNATLFVAALMLGSRLAIFVGLIPSVIALSVGTLPAPLAPMVPYIMLSNALLILSFGALREKNYWMAVAVASFLKFAFLFASSSVVIGLLMKQELAQSVAAMMSYPQFLTALLGGVLAYAFVNVSRKEV